MTKKLFVVLVVVSAMLISFSLVMAAKNAGFRHTPDQFVKTFFSNQQNATELPKAPQISPKVALSEQTGQPMRGAPHPITNTRTLTRLGVQGNSGKDLCNLMGGSDWIITDWLYGDEWYATYQDPAEFGCTSVWPFKATEVDFALYFLPEWVGGDVVLQGYILENVGTPTCPAPGYDPANTICSTPQYTFTIPAGEGAYLLPMPLVDECCIYQPYFAAVYIATTGLTDAGPFTDNNPVSCRSYNAWYGTWVDVVSGIGFPGSVLCYSIGYTHPQNDCPVLDYCSVQSVTPPSISILPGATADFTANVTFQGSQTSCFLTVTPDPACPSCVTTITPNPVVLPATTATVSIATSATTTPGTYVFDVGGAKSSATLIVLALQDSCEVKRWITASGYYFDGWGEGDQNAVLLDPAMCTACGPNIYPFQIQKINSRWVNWSSPAATSLDVIFHIYEAPTPYCNGPGAEIYQFPATITAWSPNYVQSTLPDVICVNGPFWLSAEYVSVTPAGPFPALRMSNQTYADTCSQFNFYQGSWYEWVDFWGNPPTGYLYLSAIGNCNGEACPIECNMQEDNGSIASYFSQLKDGDKVAKFYDPEVYCTAPVYPYRVQDATLMMYVPSAWGAKTVDVKIGIYLQCQNPCDGPGTQIYLSPKVTLNVPTGVSTFNIELPGAICVYEPFFVALEYNSGTAGATPSILFDNNTIPVDTCHAWMYFGPYSPPWYEWSDFWSPPAPGRPMIRVSGATNSPICNPPPCDTGLEMLAGASYSAYYWKQPPNDELMNMKFEMPSDHGGRLEAFEVAFYWPSTHPSWGTPDPDFYVWLSDGTYPLDNNPPYQAIASYHLNYSQLVFYPSYNYIPTFTQMLQFEPGEMFHIGFTHAFEPGDTLSILSNDGGEPGVANNPSGWYNGAWESYAPYAFLIDAFICPYAPEVPTFTMKCFPSIGYATPGDPPINVFQVGLSPVLAYSLPVTMSLLSVSPAANITATFNPNPATPPDTADVAITVGVGVPYGNYTLTFQGVGSDNQTKVCNVTLTVQPPFDEAVVNFFHGKQRTSNFGAVGNDGAGMQNFVWYGTNYLFDGSFLSATTGPDHIAMDIYNCTHYGFIPSQHVVVTHQPWCSSPYEENYGEVAYSNFYTEESTISCEYDSLFVVGLSDVPSTDFSIKIKIYYNPTSTPIPELHIGLFEDWDIGDAYNNWADMDTLHNILWQYDPLDPSLVFGMFKAPFYDEKMLNMAAVRNPVYVWPGAGFCDPGFPEMLDSLYLLMTRPGYTYATMPDTDLSLLMCPPPFALNPGDKHIEVWFDFGRNLNDGFTWEQWYHKLLRYAGFYRGDVNASDTLELPALDVSDLVYLINYLYEGGPTPQPFIDQGNVDGKGPYGGPVDTVCPKNNVDVQDLVYLVNYVFKSGPAPIDYVRFIPQFWSRTSLFTNPNW